MKDVVLVEYVVRHPRNRTACHHKDVDQACNGEGNGSTAADPIHPS